MDTKNRMLLSTRKGLIVYEKNGSWKHQSTHFLGAPVSLSFVDTRNNTWWACLDHGHWGCKLHRSQDEGANWEEVEVPKYPEGEEVKEGVPAAVRYLWAFAAGSGDQAGNILVGTEPGGLFESQDNGDTFTLNRPLWDHPSRKDNWFGGGRDYPGIHSVVVDPRNSDHFYIGISCAGVFETTDAGQTWAVRNKGLRADFMPDPNVEVGHDPHLLVACPSNPDKMWQQNHCGIFRTTDGAQNWEEVTEDDGPAKFGFAVAVDENDGDVAWVVPAVSDQVRVAVDGAMCVCRTDDGGKTWQDFRKGLPQENVFDITFRHALDITGDTLAFGTTTGNLYLSEDRGESWETLSNNLPMIHSVDFI